MAETPDFTLQVEGVKGLCPAGERWAERQIAAGRIPVFACEGGCIRGEIARHAANRVTQQEPYARACHAETFFVPHSGMAQWVRQAKKVVVIDGCFLKCHGRPLKSLIGEEKLIQIEALPLHKRHSDVFLMDDVAEAERKEIGDEVGAKILAVLRDGARPAAG